MMGQVAWPPHKLTLATLGQMARAVPAGMSRTLVGEEAPNAEEQDRSTWKQEEESEEETDTGELRTMITPPAAPNVAVLRREPREKFPSMRAKMIDIVKGDIDRYVGNVGLIGRAMAKGVIGQTNRVNLEGFTVER